MAAGPGIFQPRLREFRERRGLTQQEVAAELTKLAWSREHQRVGVNADMVSKWERGEKRPSRMYRELYCLLFRVTSAELGLTAAGPFPDLLEPQLAAPGLPSRHLQSSLHVSKDEFVDRRSLLMLLGAASLSIALPGRADALATTARSSTSAADVLDDAERLAVRYQELYHSVDPTVLLRQAVAHLDAVSRQLRARVLGPNRTARFLMSCMTAAAVLLFLAACSGSRPALRVSADHVVGDVDVPLRIVVSGVPKAADVSVVLTAADALGVTWRSAAVYRATNGVVDLSTAAPVSGSYTGVHGMGLFWSMKPVAGPRNDTDFTYGKGGYTATLTASARGRGDGAVSLKRWAQAPGVAAEDERPGNVGFYGEYYNLPAGSVRRPAVVVLGGSEGGLAVDALTRLLASDGFPTLALAYFNEPGLPGGVTDIPLEYFARAIAWLKQQPAVDPAHVYLLGISRGAEAALLVAAHFPGVVYGVVAAAPTSVVNPPEPGPRGAAWTFGGQQIPGVSEDEVGMPDPPEGKAVQIPVARFAGSIMLVCGTDDEVWPSCGYATMIEQERISAGFSKDVVVRVPAAGHGVASLVPYVSEATTAPFGGERMGGTAGADGAGRALAWQRMLGFLQRS